MFAPDYKKPKRRKIKVISALGEILSVVSDFDDDDYDYCEMNEFLLESPLGTNQSNIAEVKST